MAAAFLSQINLYRSVFSVELHQCMSEWQFVHCTWHAANECAWERGACFIALEKYKTNALVAKPRGSFGKRPCVDAGTCVIVSVTCAERKVGDFWISRVSDASVWRAASGNSENHMWNHNWSIPWIQTDDPCNTQVHGLCTNWAQRAGFREKHLINVGTHWNSWLSNTSEQGFWLCNALNRGDAWAMCFAVGWRECKRSLIQGIGVEYQKLH